MLLKVTNEYKKKIYIFFIQFYTYCCIGFISQQERDSEICVVLYFINDAYVDIWWSN